MKLSIVIPAYNEERRISKTLDNYYAFFRKKLKNNFEIIIVPNNCRDKTPKIAEKYSKKYKQIKSLNIPYYVAKGGAVLEGFKIAKGDLVGFVDADSSTSPEAYYDLYLNIENYEGIIASRSIKGARVNIKQNLLRRILGKLFWLYVAVLFGLTYKDTQCGAKIFKKNVIKYLIKENYIKRWAFDIDLLYTCKRHGFKIKEFPTIWVDSSYSVLTPWKTSLEMGFDAIKLRIHNL